MFEEWRIFRRLRRNQREKIHDVDFVSSKNDTGVRNILFTHKKVTFLRREYEANRRLSKIDARTSIPG